MSCKVSVELSEYVHLLSFGFRLLILSERVRSGLQTYNSSVLLFSARWSFYPIVLNASCAKLLSATICKQMHICLTYFIRNYLLVLFIFLKLNIFYLFDQQDNEMSTNLATYFTCLAVCQTILHFTLTSLIQYNIILINHESMTSIEANP